MRLDLGDKGGIAQCLESLAASAGVSSRPERAATLFGTAVRMREEIGSRLSPAERVAYEHDHAAARALTDEAVFKAALEAGRAMTIEQAIAYALVDACEDAATDSS